MAEIENSAGWPQGKYDEAEEFARSVRLSLIGVTPRGAATFRPAADSISLDWDTWSSTTFSQYIGPLFCEAYQLGLRFQLREIARLDAELPGMLCPEICGDLVAGAVPFVEGKDEMRCHPEWKKYQKLIKTGRAPGHLPIVFALHSVLYHLPQSCALAAYAWYEWVRGNCWAGCGDGAGKPESPPAPFMRIRPQIARLVGKTLAAPGLRTL